MAHNLHLHLGGVEHSTNECYVGLGESAEDLRVFDPAAFVDGLLPEHLGGD